MKGRVVTLNKFKRNPHELSRRPKPTKEMKSLTWSLCPQFKPAFSLLLWFMKNVFSRQQKQGRVLKSMERSLMQVHQMAKSDQASRYRFEGPIQHLQICGDGSNSLSVETKPDISGRVPRPIPPIQAASPTSALVSQTTTFDQPLPARKPVHDEEGNSSSSPGISTEEDTEEKTLPEKYSRQCTDRWNTYESDSCSDFDCDPDYWDGSSDDSWDPYDFDVCDIDDGGIVGGLISKSQDCFTKMSDLMDTFMNQLDQSNVSEDTCQDVESDQPTNDMYQDQDLESDGSGVVGQMQNKNCQSEGSESGSCQDKGFESGGPKSILLKSDVSTNDPNQVRGFESGGSKNDPSQVRGFESGGSKNDPSQVRGFEPGGLKNDPSQVRGFESGGSKDDPSQVRGFESGRSKNDPSQVKNIELAKWKSDPCQVKDFESDGSKSDPCHDKNFESGGCKSFSYQVKDFESSGSKSVPCQDRNFEIDGSGTGTYRAPVTSSDLNTESNVPAVDFCQDSGSGVSEKNVCHKLGSGSKVSVTGGHHDKTLDPGSAVSAVDEYQATNMKSCMSREHVFQGDDFVSLTGRNTCQHADTRSDESAHDSCQINVESAEGETGTAWNQGNSSNISSQPEIFYVSISNGEKNPSIVEKPSFVQTKDERSFSMQIRHDRSPPTQINVSMPFPVQATACMSPPGSNTDEMSLAEQAKTEIFFPTKAFDKQFFLSKSAIEKSPSARGRSGERFASAYAMNETERSFFAHDIHVRLLPAQSMNENFPSAYDMDVSCSTHDMDVGSSAHTVGERSFSAPAVEVKFPPAHDMDERFPPAP